MLDELQLLVLEELVNKYHLVMADDLPDGSVSLTPCLFCPVCEGDGCLDCGDKGGIPIVLTPTIVPPIGERRL